MLHPYRRATHRKAQLQFSFVFTPVTGSTGETLKLNVFSVNNAQFQPDMKTSTSYGFYHDILQSNVTLKFTTDTDYGGEKVQAAVSSVGVTTEDMTSDFINSYLNLGFVSNGQSMEDRLDDTVYEFIDYNNETVYDNINVTNLDTWLYGSALPADRLP